MNKLYDYFKNLYEDGKLTQAFLIGNVTLNSIKSELMKIFKEFIFHSKMNVEVNPNIYFLGEDNDTIKKDDIKELLKNLSTTAQFDNIKIYVINACENLNDYSYNAILKTLEEPPSGVYAFLLTSNIDAVKPTISSRCQKIFISSFVDNDFDNTYIDIANSFIENIELYGVDTINRLPKIYKQIESREMLLNIVKYIQSIYMEELNNLVNNDNIKNSILTNNDLNSFTKKILVINENIMRLENNLNKNLSIDRFIIEMGRCNI